MIEASLREDHREPKGIRERQGKARRAKVKEKNRKL
jgi:hypothetical protein